MYVLSAVYSDGVSQQIDDKPHESLSQARMWAQQHLYENPYIDAVEIWIQTVSYRRPVETVTPAAAHDWGL